MASSGNSASESATVPNRVFCSRTDAFRPVAHLRARVAHDNSPLQIDTEPFFFLAVFADLQVPFVAADVRYTIPGFKPLP